MPKVTVIIPAYNAMKFLPETVENLLQQTYQDFEVVIVNDGSQDHIQSWHRELNNLKIKLVTQDNQGLSGARNTGILHAQGEYFALLDADDLWHPSKLEKQVQVLDENPKAGLVYTWTALVDAEGQPTGRIFKGYVEGNVWKKLIEFNVVGCGSVPLIRKLCFETVGVFDRNLGSFVEDWDLWLRIAPHFDFKVIKEPLVYYRQLPSSASRNLEAMERSYKIVLEKAFKSVPAELQYLQARSYGIINLYLAWKPLQGQAANPDLALAFQRKAFSHYPQVIFTREFWRLSVSIFISKCFGSETYKKLLVWGYALRRRVVQFPGVDS
jgi:glycosyltransferase involved in cell wall biosynthesis